MIYYITEIKKDKKIYWGSITYEGTFKEACKIFFNGYEKNKILIQEK